MADDDSSDGLDDLQDMLAAYRAEASPDSNEPPGSKSKNKPLKTEAPPSYVEVPMEKMVFGDKQTFLTNLAKSVGRKRAKGGEKNGDFDANESEEDPAKKIKPAWSDSDDEDIEVGDVKRETHRSGPLNHLRKDKSYKEYLTARFQRTVNEPKWASLNQKEKKTGEDSDDSEDEELLKTVGFIDRKAKTGSLQSKTLFFKRQQDLNRTTYSEGRIESVQFHPTSRAALVAGQNCMATIYSVDGQKNDKLHSINFKQFPITCARITPCGTKAFFGSERYFYYAYDLIEAQETKLKLPGNIKSMNLFEVSPCGKYIASAGKFGAIHLIASNSNELIHSFKQEGQLRGLCFTADSKRLICCGSSCDINILSLRQNQIEHKFIDEGCINGSTIQLSPNQRMLATGSNEGVVNVYDYDKVFNSTAPHPEKSFMNLRTSVTDMQFNHSSELLAMCSRQVKNSVKIAHFPSATIYANFPNAKDRMGCINVVSFSPNSAYLAFGTQNKMAPLYRLKHFQNY